MENTPIFTKEQEDWICHQIGEWYLEWKNKITDRQEHRLGYAKELLKERLCASSIPSTENLVAKALLERCLFNKAEDK